MSKVIAYLDILGYGGYTNTNIATAINLLSDYQGVVNSKIVDRELNPIKSFPHNHQELADSSNIDSFEYFLPFSDSLFIQSSDPDKFIKQLSNFLLACFWLRANNYSNPEDPTDPSAVTVAHFSCDSGKVKRECQSISWPPLVFRGGISYGESAVVSVNAIDNSELKTINNLVGSALVKAVKELEPLDKGPRLFCDKEFIQQLKPESSQYWRHVVGNNFEILWPAFYFVPGNSAEIEINSIGELLQPIGNLWTTYRDKPYGCHYWEFLVLAVNSSLQYFGSIGKKEMARQAVLESIEGLGLKLVGAELESSV